jgi:hypothetical protein
MKLHITKNIVQLDENNIIASNDRKTRCVEPILEIYKGKLYCNIIRHFIHECINTFGNKIFSIKKSYQRTITNILSSWMFSLYATYDFADDYFFPSNYSNVGILYDIIKDLCKFDETITNKQYLIDNLLNNLVNYYEKQLNLLEEYEMADLYKKNKNNYTINKIIYEQTRNNKVITFYKFNITIKYNIKDNRLQNILNNILLPIHIYDKLANKYVGPKDQLDTYIWAIIYRYQLLGSNNHQLAVLPTIMEKLNTDYNLGFEFFASAINSNFTHYCSIYYDLERYFGSFGNFFDVEPIKGTFGFNPPYQTDIIINGLNKLLGHLDNTNEHLTFIITIPVWDTDGKNEIKKLYNNDLNKKNIDYGDFYIINKIKTSKYFRECNMIAKENFTYIDHNFMLLKNKTIQNTYVIILSNNSTCNNIKNYDFFNYQL